LAINVGGGIEPMLSDSIFEYLHYPRGAGTTKDHVRWLLEALDHYSQPPFDYGPEYLAILRKLAKDYLRKPSFERLMALLRSAIAYMRVQDSSSSTGAWVEIVDGGIMHYPNGKPHGRETLHLETEYDS
jgi:hypothetical protein